MKANSEPIVLSHHANLIIGAESERNILLDLLERSGIKIAGNPDFYDMQFANLGIDDARRLKADHDTRPVSVSRLKIFVITAAAATVEAQNALLKLFEEPAEYARFYLIVPSLHVLLLTMRSRMSVLNLDMSAYTKATKTKTLAASGINIFAKTFASADKSKRLEMAKKLVDEIADEKRPRQDAIELLDEVQRIVRDERGIRAGVNVLEAIEIARKYAGDRGASLKMLLDYVALSL